MYLKIGGAVLALFLFVALSGAPSALTPIVPSTGCAGAPSASSSPLSGTSFNPIGFNGCINNAIALSAIGILLSFAIIAAAYLIGEVFGMEGLKGWYKTELWEVTKTILVIVIVFSIISILGSIAQGLTGGSIPSQNGYAGCSGGTGFTSLYCFADNYLGQQSVYATGALDAAIGESIGIAAMKSVTFMTYVPIPIVIPTPAGPVTVASINFGSDENVFKSDIFETSPISGSSFLKDSINLFIIPMYLVLGTLYSLLYVIVNLGLAVFLPLGIVFRAIPFLRGIGGTLIALGIGTAIVLPTMFLAVNNPVTNLLLPTYQSYGSPGTCVTVSGNQVSQLLCNMFTQLTSSIFNPLAAAALASLGTQQYGSGNYFNPAYDGYNAGTNSLFVFAYPTINVIFFYLLPLIFDFILLIVDLIFGYAIVNGIAKMLGGSIRLGFGKVSVA